MDNSGYIWISSFNGAFKFDGSHLYKYSSDPDRLGEIIQSDFFEDSRGFIWTTTNIGLSRYHPLKDSFELFPVYLDAQRQPSDNYFLFHLESDSTLWLRANEYIIKYNPYAQNGEKICRTEGVRFTVDTFPTGHVKRIYSCPWLNNEGLEVISLEADIIQKDHIRKEQFPFHPKPIEISQVVIQDSLTGWAISSYGIYEIDLLNLTVTGHFLAPSTSNIFTYALRKDDHSMLVTNRNSGVWEFNFSQRSFTPAYQRTRDISGEIFSNSTRAVYQDRYENLWISQLNSGVVNYTWTGQNEFENPLEELGAQAVEYLVEDDRQNMWISVKNQGIFQLDHTGKIEQHFSPHQLAKTEEIPLPFSLNYDGALWATGSNLVQKFDPLNKTWKTALRGDGERFFQLLSMLSGEKLLLSSKSLYIVTEQADSLTATVVENLEINPLRVTRMFKGARDRVYLPLDEKKLCIYQFRDNRLSLLDSIETQSSINSVIDGKNGDLWIGTGLGLMHCDPGSDEYSLIRLPIRENDFVSAFSLVEQNGKIWITSNQGLWCYDPPSESLNRFRMEEGLVSNNFALYGLGQSKSGKLWLGTDLGLVVFQPDSTRPYPFGPKVILKKITVNGINSKQINPFGLDKLNLPYSQNSLTVDPVAINYYHPEYDRIYYRVLGHIDQWQEMVDEKRIQLLLPPGIFQLELYAQNVNLVNGEISRFTFEISPPYWQTAWFKILILVSLSGLAYLLFRLSLHRKLMLQAEEFKRQQEIQAALQFERNRVAAEMHDDIAGGLTSIRILSERLKDNVATSELPTIEKINEYANRLVENMREIIWSMNTSYDYLNDTVAYLRHFLMEMLDDTGIQSELKVEIDPSNNFIMPGKLRRNVLMIIKEAIHNIIKHASATQVMIYFSLKDDHFIFTLHDNGTGLNEITPGNGLRNMKKRAIEINSLLDFVNEGGLKITLRIPTQQFSIINTKPS